MRRFRNLGVSLFFSGFEFKVGVVVFRVWGWGLGRGV